MMNHDNLLTTTSGRCITQVAKVSLDPLYFELTADFAGMFL